MDDPYLLSDKVVFVEGSCNGAIYDLNTTDVYWIDREYVEILNDYILGRSLESNLQYIDYLRDKHLLDDLLIKPYFIEKPSIFLKFAWLELTSNCNLRCVHCYGKFGYSKVEKELSKREWIKIIEDLKHMGCSLIEFIGGEPTLNNNLKELLLYAHSLGIKTNLFTNGSFIDDELINILAETNTKVIVSIYSCFAKIHDMITQKEGSLDQTIKNIRRMIMANIEVESSTIIMNINEEYLHETKQFLKDIGVKHQKEDLIRGEGLDIIQPSFSQIDRFLHKKPGFRTNLNSFTNNYYFNSCWCGKVAIKSNGDVIPCVFDREHVLGNILESSFNSIISGEYVKYLEEFCLSNIFGCSKCEFRYCCKDCRIIANPENGKQNRCLYDPITGVWKQSISSVGND